MAEEEKKEETEVKIDGQEATAQEPEKAAEPETSKEPDPATSKDSAEVNWKTLYAITLADFDNYKKRAARDREDVYRYAESDILKDILPTVDNLGLALDKAENKDDKFVQGVKLVYDNLLKALESHDAKPFDSVGLELDTEKMEAIATLPSEEVEEGKVSIESKKGWTLKGKVLRAAQVVVSAGKSA